MANQVEWADPPMTTVRGSVGASKYLTPEFVAQLDQNPGRWAVLIRGTSRSTGIGVSMWCRTSLQYQTVNRGAGEFCDVYIRRIPNSPTREEEK